jgi:hypothetical protein
MLCCVAATTAVQMFCSVAATTAVQMFCCVAATPSQLKIIIISVENI